MSMRFVVVAEDRQSFALATALCERVVAERSTWLRDHWGSEETRRSFRVWDKLDPSSHDAWTTRGDIKRLGRTLAMGSHPLGLKAEGALAYKAMKLALLRAADGNAADALFLVHDSDGDEETARRMQAGAAAAISTVRTTLPVVAVPHPEAEAWVAAGIVPATPEERSKHEEERKRLGFDPITEPHRLSSGKSTDKRDAKRTCAAILGRTYDEDPERWERCWEETALPVLETNGRGAGLRDYTEQVEQIILPLLGDRLG